jgi:hypothetical protein
MIIVVFTGGARAKTGKVGRTGLWEANNNIRPKKVLRKVQSGKSGAKCREESEMVISHETRRA